MIKIDSSGTNLNQVVQDVVDQWFVDQCRNGNTYAEYYLHHKSGYLTIAETAENGFMLSSAIRISPSWSKPQAYAYVWKIARGLPILPPE